MAELGNGFVNMSDFARSMSADGNVDGDVLNLLTETNEMMDDALATPCNQKTYHETTVINGIPNGNLNWGRLNKGIPQSKVNRAKVKETTAFTEDRSSVDARFEEVYGSGNFSTFRLQEASGILEGMSQGVADALFYENADTNPDGITGLAPRYNTKSAENGSQIIDAGGTGSDNTSIWFVQWGSNACHLIYPEATVAGVKREDHGKQRVLDADGNPFYAYEETFRWHLGVCIRDWRKIVRIANIDVSDMQAGSVDLYKWMRKAFYQGHGFRKADMGTRAKGSILDGNFAMGRTAIYCNKDVFEALDATQTNSNGSDNFTRLRVGEIEGKEVTTYRGLPIRQVDALKNTEARVV